MLQLTDAVNCNSLDQLNQLSSDNGFHFFWQKQTENNVYTYDKMPEGLLSLYYSQDIDLKCPMAWAFRGRNWPVFTASQAISDVIFSQYDPDYVSTTLWNSFDIKDSLWVQSSIPGLCSFAVFGFNHEAPDPNTLSLPYIVLSQKMNFWLKDRMDLTCTKREFSSLSPKETEALKVSVAFPFLSIKQQAGKLGVSEQTLLSRHGRINKKLGVPRFSGATLLAERTGFFQ